MQYQIQDFQESNPRFKTGEVAFRITSSSTNDRSQSPETFADAIYFAKGTLEVEQETIVATRNGIVVQDTVTDNSTVTSNRIVSTRRIPPPPRRWRGGGPWWLLFRCWNSDDNK